MDIRYQTEDEAFIAFNKNSVFPTWIALSLCEHKFPICVHVDDSRENAQDKEDDYLLKKHFLTIERGSDEVFSIRYYISREPEGELNKPFESESETTDYQWPVNSMKHAHDMIYNFILLMKFNKTT